MRRPPTSTNPAPIRDLLSLEARPLFQGWLMGILLILVTLALYWPVRRYSFLNLDDPVFVTENPHVQGGLSWAGIKWAFQLTQNQVDYWHPLAWLSLMLDVSLFGPATGGLHLTNVALHAANSVLVLLLLRMLTGAFWRSVVVAALFAFHPLRVESVAWVTERKDVLSTFFGLLSLLFYVRYAQKRSCVESRVSRAKPSGPALGSGRWTTDYGLALFFLACGLMSKAMLVTWPFVMLLLDYWPLRRMQKAEGRRQNGVAVGKLHASRSTPLRLVGEKIPFFVLSGILCVLTYLTERGPHQAVGLAESPALHRLENAFVAYGRYLGKTFWPVELAVPYVNPDYWSWLQVGGSLLLVVGVCLAAFCLGRRWPYLLIGWCWFLGTLVPVIGLTRGWGAFMADRFTYVPSIGVLILAVWGVCDLTRGWRYQVLVSSVAFGVTLVLCLALTQQQLGYWRDNEALFQHALQVTENNDVAHNCLGVAFGKKDQTEAAIRQYQEAIRLKPNLPVPHYNLGVAFAKDGQTDEAIRQYQEAIRLKPDYANAHNSLGNAFAKKGEADEAIYQYQEAVRLQPDHADARYNLGNALASKGQTDEAIFQFRAVIRLKPDHAETHNNLGYALFRKGQTEEAIRQYQEALRLKPDFSTARNNLQLALASKARSSQPAGVPTNR